MPNNILIPQPNGLWATIATTETGGIHTVALSLAASNSWVLVQQPDGSWIRLASVLTGSVHTICATAA